MKDNVVTAIARRHKRDYITPEDVGDALLAHGATQVRLAVLEVLGNMTAFGAEDSSLCAFVAAEGKP